MFAKLKPNQIMSMQSAPPSPTTTAESGDPGQFWMSGDPHVKVKAKNQEPVCFVSGSEIIFSMTIISGIGGIRNVNFHPIQFPAHL